MRCRARGAGRDGRPRRPGPEGGIVGVVQPAADLVRTDPGLGQNPAHGGPGHRQAPFAQVTGDRRPVTGDERRPGPRRSDMRRKCEGGRVAARSCWKQIQEGIMLAPAPPARTRKSAFGATWRCLDIANTVTFCDGQGVFFVAASGQFRDGRQHRPAAADVRTPPAGQDM